MIYFIVTGYNCEKYVNKCVNSILSQRYKDFRLIIVDDGSTDQTAQLIKGYQSVYKITVARSDKNMGAAHSRFMGLELARHMKIEDEDIIILVDMDDYLIGTHVLDRILQEYENGADCTFGSFTSASGWEPKGWYDDEVLRSRYFRGKGWLFFPLRTFKYKLCKHLTEDWFKWPGGEWIRICTDVALISPIVERCEYGKIHHIPDMLYFYNNRTGNNAGVRYFGKRKETMRYLRRLHNDLSVQTV